MIVLKNVKTSSERLLQIYEYLCYLSSSAQGLFLEPREYGPLRCIDAMRRFIDLVIKIGIIEEEDQVRELVELKDKLSKGLALYDLVEFEKFVRELNNELSTKIIKLLNIGQ